MGVFKGVWLGLLLATVTAGAHAQSQNQFQGPKVMGLLPGYSCMALNLTVDQKSWDALPPVYAEPSARSVRIGIATATVCQPSLSGVGAPALPLAVTLTDCFVGERSRIESDVARACALVSGTPSVDAVPASATRLPSSTTTSPPATSTA